MTKENKATVQRLLGLLSEITGDRAQADMDELVHDLKSYEASDINEGGFEDQISYVIESMGAKGAEKAIKELESIKRAIKKT